MSLTPSYKWPDGPGYFNTKEGKIFAGYNSLGNNGVFLFREIIDGINVSEIHYHGENDPVTLWSTTLDNDVVLKLIAYQDYNNNLAVARFNAYYNNVEFTNQQYRDSGIITGLNNELHSSLYIDGAKPYGSALMNIPAKLVISTFYPANPVENTTPADGFGFELYIAGGRLLNDEALINDLSAIQTGVQLTFSNLTTVKDNQGNDQRVDYVGNRWMFHNLDTLNTYMRTAGTGTPNNITGGSNQEPIAPEDDTSGTGGGGGSYDPTSDPIDFPSLPTGGALTSGMIKGFVIGSVALSQLQNKLWDMSIFDIATQFQKLVNQPLDCLISLHALPVLPTTGNSEEIKLGSFATGVNGLRITNQYVTIDCGTYTVPLFWGSALDYAPYTTAAIYLPFIGIRELKIEDIQGLTIGLKYHVDVLNGSCTAFIKCGASVLYSFTGSCIQHIPATSQTSDLLHNNISSIGPVAVGLATGNPAAAVAGGVAGAINSATAKNHVSRSGDLAGSAGILGEFTPYLIFHRPKQSLAKNYNRFKGYPCNITYTLSSLTGYTEVEHVHLTGITGATDTELSEIERLLKKGVII